MRSFKAAPEVLSAWMDERKLTAAEAEELKELIDRTTWEG